MTIDWKALTEIVSSITGMISAIGVGWLAYKQAELRANVKDVKAQTQTVLTHTTAQTGKINKIESTVAEVAANTDAVRCEQARILAAAWLSPGSGKAPDT